MVIAIWEMIGDCLVVTLQIKMINDVVLTLIQQRTLSKSQGMNKMGPSNWANTTALNNTNTNKVLLCPNWKLK